MKRTTDFVSRFSRRHNLHTALVFLCILTGVFLLLVQGVAAGEYYKLVDSWGGQGQGEGQFRAPMGVATDAAGNVYVCDNYDYRDIFSSGSVSRIQKFDAEGDFLKSWAPDIADSYLNYGISGIAVGGPSGDIYANIVAITPLSPETRTFTMDSYVQVFSPDGTPEDRWGPYSSVLVDMSGGFENLQIQAPLDIAVDSGGNAYVTSLQVSMVTQTTRSVVLKFTPGGEDPVVLLESTGTSGDPMDVYYGIDADPSDRLYVTIWHMIGDGEWAGSSVQKYDATGNFITRWNIQNLGDEEPDMAGGISVGSGGNVSIIDQSVSPDNGELLYLQEYASDGTYICQGEPFGTGDGEIVNPFLGELGGALGIAVDPAGESVYVVDASTYQVLKFRKDSTGGTNLVVGVTGPLMVKQGSRITYTIHYHNIGYVIANDVTLEDLLDDQVDFVSGSVPYDSSTGSVKWTIGTLNPGEHGTKYLVVEVPPAVAEGATITNRVVLRSSTEDTQPGDNEGSTDTVVIPPDLPLGIAVEPSTGGGPGGVIVYWMNPIEFTYRDPVPDSDIASIGISITINGETLTGFLEKDPEGVWRTTMDPFSPLHGDAKVTYSIHRDGKPDEEKSFGLYVDPAGYVYDRDSGTRIPGASVWLQRPDGNGGWENVPQGENPEVMQPDTNPLITNAQGQYQWDVLEGSYRVHVEAQGYLPADSIMVSIPPPVTDLHVGLKKMGTTPVPEFSSAILPATMIIGTLGMVLFIQRKREQ